MLGVNLYSANSQCVQSLLEKMFSNKLSNFSEGGHFNVQQNTFVLHFFKTLNSIHSTTASKIMLQVRKYADCQKYFKVSTIEFISLNAGRNI